MENIELKDNKELSKYIKELNEDLELTTQNLREKSLLISTIRSKWLSYLFKEKENLDRIKATKTKIISAHNSSTDKTVLRLKSETMFEENDERIKKLNELQKITTSNIDFIERAMNILNDFVWQIKNCIEVIKLQNI